jgi:branched-chain amino acid transport system substrate-binding protein
MKRSLVVICVFLVFAACICAEAQEITIGVDLSTTGPSASLGIPNKNAMLLAPNVIGGQKVRYVYLDDASDPTLALQNVKRLITQDNIDVLIGPSVTPTTLAVIETIATAKVPMLTFGSTSRLVLPMDEQKKWVFKPTPNDDIFSGAEVNHMAKNGVKTLSLIVVDDPYGESWTEITTRLAAPRGIKILTVEKFNRDDSSATPQALRAMRGNPDAILIAAVGTPAATPHRALVERGYKGKIYHAGGMVNADFLRVGGKAVEGAYSPTPPLVVTEQLPNGYPTKKAGLEFLKLYEAKYGAGTRSQYAGHSWDATKLLDVAIPVAIKKGKPGTVQFRQALRDALENAKEVDGVQAVFNMTPADHSGIDQRGMVMVRIENGTWKLVDYPKF